MLMARQHLSLLGLTTARGVAILHPSQCELNLILQAGRAINYFMEIVAYLRE